MTFYIVDAFTTSPFGGNTAGVVLLDGAEFPEEQLMNSVAAELRYSETAFVLQHTEQVLSVRYFTPSAEIDICGHATIAAFSVLHYLKHVSGQCLCHTRAGDLNIECGGYVMMQMPPPVLLDVIKGEDAFFESIGLECFIPSLPIRIVSTGLPDIMLQVPDIKTLNFLKPDMKRISEITADYNAISLHVFAFANDQFTAHVRNFAPRYGIPEEPATGTANAALTYFLLTEGIISGSGVFSFIQGEVLKRPSIISTRIYSDHSIYVGGQAVIVAKGELNV